MSAKLIKNLQKAELYNHSVNYFKVIETHISWVILTGKRAYKIKKPIDFEFLNFTDLASRKFYCELELQMNKKLAPEIYLDVVAITGTEDQPQINGTAPVIEYALRMQEFPQENMFDHLLERGALSPIHFKQTADVLAAFHAKTEKDGPAYFGTPEQIFEPVIQNFDQIRPLLTTDEDISSLAELETWSREAHQRLLPVFKQRKQAGFVRACHGDVHLGNITLFNNRPVIFDCIEFNESFRWTDVMADTGFLMMDLHERQQEEFAHIFLSQYLLDSGDYAGLQVLPYYQAYRAMVRAKISLLDRLQHLDNPPKAQQLLEKYRRFIQLVKYYAKPQTPYLLITHGLSASGKSTLAEILVKKLGVIQIRSDVERKRLHHLKATDKSYSGLYTDMYDAEITDKTYGKLSEIAEQCLAASYPVIVDATFLQQKHRQAFAALAAARKIPYLIIHCQADLETLLSRIHDRSRQASISEADQQVLMAQQHCIEPLTREELPCSVSLNTDMKLSVEDVQRIIADKLASVKQV